MMISARERLHDPAPYDGPIRRIDGERPFNRYLWPLPGDCHTHRISRFRIGIVALADGTWLADGHIWSQQYPTREAAIRVAVARVVSTVRNARRWSGQYRVSEADAKCVIKWAYSILRIPPPQLREIPRPAAPSAPLPTLLDLMERAEVVG